MRQIRIILKKATLAQEYKHGSVNEQIRFKTKFNSLNQRMLVLSDQIKNAAELSSLGGKSAFKSLSV